MKAKKYATKKRFRRSTKRKPTVRTLAKKVNKLVSSIERKYYETGAESIAPDNLPSVVFRPYTNISQGLLDRANRVGDKINVTSLKFQSIWTVTADVAPPVGRVIAFIYKHNPDGIAVSVATIINLYLDSAYVNSELTVLAPTDYDNRNSFVTLYDQKRTLTQQASGIPGVHQWDALIRIPPKYRNVQYIAGTTTVTRNELFIVCCQEQDTNISFNYAYRLFFTDA